MRVLKLAEGPHRKLIHSGWSHQGKESLLEEVAFNMGSTAEEEREKAEDPQLSSTSD